MRDANCTFEGAGGDVDDDESDDEVLVAFAMTSASRSSRFPMSLRSSLFDSIV